MKRILLTSLLILAIVDSRGQPPEGGTPNATPNAPFRLLSLERKPSPEPQMIGLALCVTIAAVACTAVYVVYSCARKIDPPNTNKTTTVQMEQSQISDLKFESKSKSKIKNTINAAESDGVAITIEWTTNLVDWIVAGVVVGSVSDFEFYHTNTAPAAFYRAVIY